MKDQESAGTVFVRVPGVSALALGHLLRAVFCCREDLPGDLAAKDPVTVPEGLIDAGTALCGHFGGKRAESYRRLFRNRAAFRVTAIAEPLAVQCVVYRHLVAAQPGLMERRPGVFGSLDAFLNSRRDELTRELARVLGRRRVGVEDFDVVVVEERMEESLRAFALAAGHWASSERVKALLRAATRFGGSLVEEFGGCPRADSPSPTVAEAFRRQNREDYALYDRAIANLAGPRAGRRADRGLILRRWRVAAPDRGPVFVFNHLPKSYGTSLRQFFGRVFGMAEDHTEFLGEAGVVDDLPFATERLTADSLLCGHFTHGAFLLPRRYPGVWADAERFQLFTFVRDPLATAVSNFHHVRRHDAAAVAREPGLYESVGSYLAALQNPIAKRLGCDAGSVDAVLGRYFFVGSAEDHVAGLPILLNRMRGVLDGAAPSASVARARAAIKWLAGQPLERTNARSASDGDEVPGAVAAEFQRVNALDYEIYRRARETTEKASA